MQKLTDETILCKCGKLLEVPAVQDVTCTCGVRWGRMLAEKGRVVRKPDPETKPEEK